MLASIALALAGDGNIRMTLEGVGPETSTVRLFCPLSGPLGSSYSGTGIWRALDVLDWLVRQGVVDLHAGIEPTDDGIALSLVASPLNTQQN